MYTFVIIEVGEQVLRGRREVGAKNKASPDKSEAHVLTPRNRNDDPRRSAAEYHTFLCANLSRQLPLRQEVASY